MSGLEALDTAAAIAQLAQYGILFAQKVVEVHKSSEGTSERLAELQSISENLRSFTDDFALPHHQTPTGKSEAEVRLQHTAQACRAEALSLLALAERLKIQGQRSKLKAVKTAFRIERHKSEIKKHERRLEELQRELHGQLLKIIEEKQGTLQVTLDQISHQQTSMEGRLLQEYAACKKELLAAVTQPVGKEDAIIQLLAGMRREWERALKRQAFLFTLRFPTMQSRYDGIADADESTYEWVFRSDPGEEGEDVNLVSWLRGYDGIFWVTGKAGSGKSTLMKYIGGEQRTIDLLNVWAGTRRPLTASFYFWNAGDSMQKSQKGLLQSILYTLLQQDPELIDMVRADLHEDITDAPYGQHDPWTLSALHRCFSLLSSRTERSNDACFCFFIDGLDEYLGDHEELVRLIHTLGKSTHVKLCVSSRPWEVFHDAFRTSIASKHRLQLHLHTRGDIATVAHQQLDDLVRDRQQDRDAVRLLVEDIVERAEGIFLWVTLVIRELVKGFRHADDVRSLRKRLDTIPPGLDKYFDYILRGIDPHYQTESARIFLCCPWAELNWLPAQAFEYIEQMSPEGVGPVDHSITCEDWGSASELQRVRKRLNGRCLDLLQVLPTRTARPFPVVQFLHRTVREFLENADVTDMLRGRVGPGFDAREALYDTHLFLLDIGWRLSDGVQDWKIRWARYVFAYARDRELDDGTTMSGSLDAAFGDIDRSFSDVDESFPVGDDWVNMIPETYLPYPDRLDIMLNSPNVIYDFLPNFKDAPKALITMIRLGLFRNARAHLSSTECMSMDQGSIFLGLASALMVMQKVLEHRKSRTVGNRDARPTTNVSDLKPIDADVARISLRHFADPEFFRSLFLRFQARKDHSLGDKHMTQNLWELYYNLVLRNLKKVDSDVRRSLWEIAAIFADNALHLTARVPLDQLEAIYQAGGAYEVYEHLSSLATRPSTVETQKERWLRLW